MLGVRLVVSLVTAIAACGCSGDSGTSGAAGTTSTTTGAAVERIVVRGHATLDGAPFDAEFVGAAVRNRGLVTPCQSTLPRVDGGLYVVEVMSETVASGCGTPGSEILLWTFTNESQYFSTAALPWPADGRPTTFDASFTTTAPKGAAPQTTEFAGEVFDHDGRRLPDGTARRGVRRKHPLRRRVGANPGRLHRIQPLRRRIRFGCRLRGRRAHHVPCRWTAGNPDFGQRPSQRPFARSHTAVAIRAVDAASAASSSSSSASGYLVTLAHVAKTIRYPCRPGTLLLSLSRS